MHTSDWLDPTATREPPADARGPAAGAFWAARWDAARLEPAPLAPAASAAVADVVAALGAARLNGGALFTRLRVTAPEPTIAWATVYGRWQQFALADALAASAALRRALPDLGDGPAPPRPGEPPRTPSGPAWYGRSAFALDGEVAAAVFSGGVHAHYPGDARAARALGVAFRAALIQERYEEVTVLHSWRAWAPWFGGAAWDQTWVVVDRRERAVALLCVTDDV